MDEVVIVEYDPRWPVMFQHEAERIGRVLPSDVLLGVEHIGSTAIPGLSAKPVIDILVSVVSPLVIEEVVAGLSTLGYEYQGEREIPGWHFFRKGAVKFRRTHHLHLMEAGHVKGQEALLFRDYLRACPDEAQHYETLKRTLAARFHSDRQAYTDAKSDFIAAALRKAQERRDLLHKALPDPAMNT